MLRTSENRVHLAPADWGGLLSLALAIMTLVGATLWQVHDLAASNRERLARFETEIAHLKADVSLMKTDIRQLVRGERR